MNVTARIGKVVRTLGLMGIMMALAGFLATNSAPVSASAAALNTSTASAVSPIANDGKIVVAVKFLSPDSSTGNAGVLVYDQKGNVVAKGVASPQSNFAAALAPGIYKVLVSAPDYKTYGQAVKIASDSATYVQATLSK